jgi:hypothetical protein
MVAKPRVNFAVSLTGQGNQNFLAAQMLRPRLPTALLRGKRGSGKFQSGNEKTATESILRSATWHQVTCFPRTAVRFANLQHSDATTGGKRLFSER